MRTFVITLPSRRDYILEQCQKHNLKVEIFDAVVGIQIGLLPDQYNKLEFPQLDANLSSGNVGCALSHYVLWNLLKYLPEEEFLILEDDCIFCEDFVNKFQNIYSSLPLDWEMAYVGWIKYGHDITPIHVNDGLSIRIPSATHAYMIKKSAIPILINSLHPLNSPIDLLIINKALKKLKYYVFDPSLIDQKSYMNYSNSKWVSSCYDWKTDIHKIKKMLYNSFKFVDGWYNIESNQADYWKWSQKTFQFICPPTHELLMEFSSVIENKLILKWDDKIYQFDVKCGFNKIVLNIFNQTPILIEGILEFTYTPCNFNLQSSDNRELGICLSKIEMCLNNIITIPINIWGDINNS
jgi:GR25 family glycosyltransferase involved in LPS biosynthesis